MSEKLDRGRQQSLVVPEYFAKILKNKDRIIRVQAKRIEMLEGEVHRLRVTRESLSSQLNVLSCKLQAVSSRSDARNKTESKYGSRVPEQMTKLQSHALESNNRRNQENRGQPGRIENSTPLITEQTVTTMQDFDNHKTTDLLTSVFNLPGDREVEQLEQRYGDYNRANRAASKIQLMFRQYSLNRNFQKLRSEVGDSSRRSQRFNKLIAESGLRVAAYDVNGRDRTSTAADPAVDRAPERSRERTVITGNVRDAGKETKPSASSSGETGADRRVRSSQSVKSPRINSDRKHFPENRQTRQIRNGHDDVSPLNAPTDIILDLPTFNFDCLLESKRKNFISSTDDGVRDGGWSSSSSSSKVSTPVDPMPLMTYVDGDFTKISDDFNECVSHGHRSPQRTSTNSYDYDNVFLSIPSKHAPNTNIAQIDGNCFRHPQKPSKVHHAPDVCVVDKKSASLQNQGHNREFKQTRENSQGCSSSGSHPFHPARPHLGHLSSDTAEPSPVWKRKSVHEAGFNVVCNHTRSSSETNEAEYRKALCSESTPVFSSSSSDAASVGSNNDLKFNSEVSSGDFEVYSPCSRGMLSEKQKKRKYRVGLNLFNRKPEKGVRFLIEHHFLDNKPSDVARFLIARKGLSKQMIGEFLGNLLRQFNMEVLECFVNEIELTGLPIDKALRKFISHFRMPGEAQKIEKLMEAFASSYISCNPDVVRKFKHPDTVFLVAYAIIMLNTDLHNNNIKPDRKMKLQDFIRNLRGIDGGADVDPDMLTGVYDRIASYPLKAANDHVMQVIKIDQMILGKKPPLALPHRRLICYCRLFEVKDPNKREKSNQHQREVFLFNDLLVITKLNSKKKDSLLYNYRESFPLFGMMLMLFELPNYKYGVQLTSNLESRILITLCASNEADRMKFVEDLNEAIMEVNEMEAIQAQEDMMTRHFPGPNCAEVLRRGKDPRAVNHDANRLSVGLVENRLSAPDCAALNKNSSTPSTGDMAEGRHRFSSGSLDSGLPSVNSGSDGSCFQEKPAPKSSTDASKFAFFARKPKSNKPSTADSN